MSGAIVKLDLDRPALPRDIYRRIVNRLRWLRLRPTLIVFRRTARGWHCKVQLSRPVAPIALVAIQAILGSDPNRETFNLVRARQLRAVPGSVRAPRYWNLLFLSKL